MEVVCVYAGIVLDYSRIGDVGLGNLRVLLIYDYLIHFTCGREYVYQFQCQLLTVVLTLNRV